MITIDGLEQDVNLSNFENLEQVLVAVAGDDCLGERIVTDVLLNGEPFSELYPHQAEDISATEIQSLEVKTAGFAQMSMDVIGELPKVIQLIANSTATVAGLFRENKLSEALELLQDLVDVSRALMETIEPLMVSQFAEGVSKDLKAFAHSFSSILTEINEAISFEDWILVADLLEYEYGAESEKLSEVLKKFQINIDKKVN